MKIIKMKILLEIKIIIRQKIEDILIINFIIKTILKIIIIKIIKMTLIKIKIIRILQENFSKMIKAKNTMINII
jgi:hypothetical protein